MDYHVKGQPISYGYTYWYINMNNNIKHKVWVNDNKDRWRLLNDNIYLRYDDALDERSKLL